MRKYYYFTSLFSLLLLVWASPALAQSTGFEAVEACVPDCNDGTANFTINGSTWTALSGVDTRIEDLSGPPLGQFLLADDGGVQAYRINTDDGQATVDFGVDAVSNITFNFAHQATGGTAQGRDNTDADIAGCVVGSLVASAGNETVSLTSAGCGEDIYSVIFTNLGVGANQRLVVDAVSWTVVSLPVEIGTFDALSDGADVTLAWTTTSEKQNAGFEVQHKVNDTFEAMGFMEGAGTTSQPQTYSFRADDLAPGQHTFRLKQIDLDGSFHYSPTVATMIDLPGAYLLSAAYPNPFNPQTQFTLMVAQTQQVQVGVYDLLGRQVAQLHNGMLSSNEAHMFRFAGEHLTSGIYLIRAVGEQFATVRQVTLLK